ncbi:MAG: DUF11 domain-containing protein [Chloroflexi bacterium]|nr:DUF11 domain-containing protein [Chloroflexota bacterium]
MTVKNLTKHTRLTIIIAILIVTGALLATTRIAHADGAVIYVDDDATGAATGLSWTDAYTDLQSALDAASTGDEIWVAVGVYTPTNGSGRNATFSLVSEVELYGGFDGSETYREQRDWEAHVTVLSGDINGNGGSSNDCLGHEPTANDAYHVVIASSADDTAILDGFTITGGQASESGGGADMYGGGIYNSGGSPTLRNLTVINNCAYMRGGGMYTKNGSPTLINVTFKNNKLTGDGGGMGIDSGSPTLINVTFISNESGGGGGLSDLGGSSTLVNVVFSNNDGGLIGGGMYCENSAPVLANVTFQGNKVYEVPPMGPPAYGGGIRVGENCSLTLDNSILWGNKGQWGAQMDVHSTASVMIDYSLIQDKDDVCSETTVTCTQVIQGDPLFASGLRLQDASPAIDAGNNNISYLLDTHDVDGDGNIDELLPYDRAGNRRWIDHPQSDTGNGTAPLIDMGAYEKSVLTLDKSVDPNLVGPGDPLVYVLTYQNNSTYDVGDVLISDPIPPHIYDLDFDSSGAQITPTGSVSYTWEVQNLAAGEGGTITITGVAGPSPTPVQSFDNVASISGVADYVDVGDTASATVVWYAADLAVDKQAAYDPATAGAPLIYTLDLTNNGFLRANDIVLTDVLPGDVTFISASPGCSETGGTVTCNLDYLDNQATAAITIAVTAPATVGQITNAVTVTAASPPDPDLGNNTATETTRISAEADLSIAKSASPDAIPAGGYLTYTLVITNNGPDLAGAVLLTDDFLPGITYAGRILALQMNEEAGATHFADGSGFGHHGSCSQHYSTCPEAGLTGMHGTVLSFDGVNDWVETEDFDINNDFTISLWVFPRKHDNGQAFISKHSAGGYNRFIFGYYNGGYHVRLRGKTYQAGDKPTTTDLWYHLVVVGRQTDPSKTEITVYRNGEVLWQHELNAVAGNMSGRGWALGQEWDGDNESDFFYGAIDEVSIYNRALSASEVLALYGPPVTVYPVISHGACHLESDGGGLSCDLGTLDSGQVVTGVISVLADINQPGTMTNIATVTGTIPDPTPGDNSAEADTLVGTDLAVGKIDTPDPVVVGAPLTYTLTVTKHNQTDITTRVTNTMANSSNIDISDPVAPYPSTISVSGLAGTVTKATVTLYDISHQYPNVIDVLLVGPGGQNVLLMSDTGSNSARIDNVTVTLDDDATNSLPTDTKFGSGTYKPTDHNDGSNDVFPSPAPGKPYGSALSVFDGTRPNGDWNLYVEEDIHSEYTGAIAGGWSLTLWTESSGTVTDVLPAGVTFVSASPGCDESDVTVICTLDVLGFQDTAVFTISTIAPSSVGPITNTVSVAGTPPDINPSNDTATERTQVSAVDLMVDKRVDTGSPAGAPLGGVVTCTLAVRNAGVVAATDVVMTDILPPAMTFRNWVVAGGATVTMQTVEWGPQDIAPNAAYTVSFTADITDSTSFAGQTITNTVYATAANAGPVEDSDSFSAGLFSVYLPVVLKD